jgi:hypothetical protein
MHSFWTACPADGCDGRVEVQINHFVKGSPGNYENPPETDEIEWEILTACPSCGLNDDSQLTDAEIERISIECYDEYEKYVDAKRDKEEDWEEWN